MPNNEKPTIAFFDLAGCNGCLLSFIFNEGEILTLTGKVKIKSFRFIHETKDEKKIDVAFVEGLVASNDDLRKLKEIRENCKTLVALGSCASTGCIPAYKNFQEQEKFLPLQYKKEEGLMDQRPAPINLFVLVDHHIPGCPPDKQQILSFIKDIARGLKPRDYDKPVCFECKLNENRCMLDDCKMCLGPITRGGCDSICINGKLECWGCRGPMPDANIPLMINLLEEKGFSKDDIRKRLRTFSGVQIEGMPKEEIKKSSLKQKAVAVHPLIIKKSEKQAGSKNKMKTKQKTAKNTKPQKPKTGAKKAEKAVVKKTAVKYVKKAAKKPVKIHPKKPVKMHLKKPAKIEKKKSILGFIKRLGK